MKTASLLVCSMLLLAALGCKQLNLRSQSPDKEDEEETEDLAESFSTKIETPFVGDYTTISGLNMIMLEGVGLVVGLDGTGDNPPVSMYRTALLEDMRRRGVADPNTIMRSPNTALVRVRAYLPPLVKKGDRFDIEVFLPENSTATSLSGGWLMECYLSEELYVPGRGVLQGHEYAKAHGPILVSTGETSEESSAGVLRRGRVLGGGLYVWQEPRDLNLFLRNDYRMTRMSQRISERIGQRFHHLDKAGLEVSLAEAKTDQKIVLKIHPRYKENYPRYLQVIRNIAFRESLVAQRVRMEQLKKDLLVPAKAEQTALRLEAIGKDGIPILRSGLESPSFEVQFHSAVALAYLGEAAGLPVLAEAAKTERAFRIFAMAAMSTLEEAEVHMRLRELMSESSAETRYGAFRSLWTLDKDDPFIRGEGLNKGEYMLHVLRTEGEPMVHLTRRQRPEIVLFGSNQKFQTPITVRAGKRILITAPAGSETVTISRYEPNKEERREVSTRISDVIRAVSELGASYPDVAQLLIQSVNQHNLPGRLEMDALPEAGRVYERPTETATALGPGTGKSTRIGRSGLSPNLFPASPTKVERSEEESPEETLNETDSPPGDGTATLSKAEGEGADGPPKKKRGFLGLFGTSDQQPEESPEETETR